MSDTDKDTAEVDKDKTVTPNPDKDSGDMVASITEAIALSMEKFGEKLTHTISQTWSQEEEYYDEEGEDESESIDVEPPHKKAKTQGQAFDVLEGMLDTALKTPAESPKAQVQVSPKKPGEVVNGALVQGPPNDPTVHGGPEYKVPVVDQDKNLVGQAVIHALQQELEVEGVTGDVDPEVA